MLSISNIYVNITKQKKQTHSPSWGVCVWPNSSIIFHLPPFTSTRPAACPTWCCTCPLVSVKHLKNDSGSSHIRDVSTATKSDFKTSSAKDLSSPQIISVRHFKNPPTDWQKKFVTPWPLCEPCEPIRRLITKTLYFPNYRRSGRRRTPWCLLVYNLVAADPLRVLRQVEGLRHCGGDARLLCAAPPRVQADVERHKASLRPPLRSCGKAALEPMSILSRLAWALGTFAGWHGDPFDICFLYGCSPKRGNIAAGFFEGSGCLDVHLQIRTFLHPAAPQITLPVLVNACILLALGQGRPQTGAALWASLFQRAMLQRAPCWCYIFHGACSATVTWTKWASPGGRIRVRGPLSAATWLVRRLEEANGTKGYVAVASMMPGSRSIAGGICIFFTSLTRKWFNTWCWKYFTNLGFPEISLRHIQKGTRPDTFHEILVV